MPEINTDIFTATKPAGLEIKYPQSGRNGNHIIQARKNLSKPDSRLPAHIRKKMDFFAYSLIGNNVNKIDPALIIKEKIINVETKDKGNQEDPRVM